MTNPYATDAELRAHADQMASYLVRRGWLSIPISERARKKRAAEYFETLKTSRDAAAKKHADAVFKDVVDKEMRMR